MAKSAKKTKTTPKRASRSAEARTTDSRESETRAPASFAPAALLEAPPPRPGMVQRFISTSILGQDIPHHVMRKQREGWLPRPADTIPKNFPMPTLNHGQWSGCVGIEGMILCEMTEELAESRRGYFQDRTDEQTQFVSSTLGQAESQHGIPISVEDESKVHRGTKVMDDA